MAEQVMLMKVHCKFRGYMYQKLTFKQSSIEKKHTPKKNKIREFFKMNLKNQSQGEIGSKNRANSHKFPLVFREFRTLLFVH